MPLLTCLEHVQIISNKSFLNFYSLMISLDDHKYANFYLKMCANEWSYRTAWTGDISRSTDYQTREQKIYVLEKKEHLKDMDWSKDQLHFTF